MNIHVDEENALERMAKTDFQLESAALWSPYWHKLIDEKCNDILQSESKLWTLSYEHPLCTYSHLQSQ